MRPERSPDLDKRPAITVVVLFGEAALSLRLLDRALRHAQSGNSSQRFSVLALQKQFILHSKMSLSRELVKAKPEWEGIISPLGLAFSLLRLYSSYVLRTGKEVGFVPVLVETRRKAL